MQKRRSPGLPRPIDLPHSSEQVRGEEIPFSVPPIRDPGGRGFGPAVQKKVARVFAPARLYVMYGATEAAARLSYLEPDMLPKKMGSIGKPIPNVDLFVADEAGRRLPPGQAGELVARSPSIMVGYWKDPEATAQAVRNGLYRTGDLGYEDKEGYLYITGRANDMIKPGGFRVSAKEVEEAIYELEESTKPRSSGGRLRARGGRQGLHRPKEGIAAWMLSKFEKPSPGLSPL